ncbi:MULTISPECIES: ion channel [Lactobacillus]|uniref:Ion channel n=1 Tax=Lactobacillus paragasseri TaxID=2107999 RepID=A0ABD5A0Q8_9LACO|nr:MULTISPECIES: ion channel [Lactobacillus]MBS7524708.1 K channel [Lactobacillus gasseri]MCZ3572703.1 ion channel [Lactobacillus gasseri]MCZ3573998.1 ion channel [Lactobacillus gasseri]MCZ3671857.1 ion channel [Lactobacillus gasseri]MCZ3673143.1 ion channel [Lactobacillus gasseri]
MLKKNFYKWFKATLAIVSIVLIVLDFAAIIDINGTNSKWFWLNNIILIILAIDYFYRLYLAKDRRAFFRNNIFELVAIIPVGIAFNWMKFAQLGDIGLYFRLLRLIRLAGLVGMLKDILHTHGILYVIYFSIAFLMLGSVAISITEHVSLDQAFWWAITTASTVGYGDISRHTISPQSLLGKLVILAMILIGVGVMGIVTSSLTAYLMRRNEGKVSIKDKDAELTLILDKLDRLEQQNKLLAQQTQNLQEQIQELKDSHTPSEWNKFKDWIEKRKDKN